MTDLEALNYFLGISADLTPSGLFLSQKKYALQLLKHAHMVTCNPSQTPVDIESKLGPEGVPIQDPTLYRSLAGGLQNLTFTRPDLFYAVQHICLYMHDPREPHFAALKRILPYVRGTVDFGPYLYVFATTSLIGYTDADWAGSPSTRRSTSGYCVFLGDNLLSWSAKGQHTISRSSAEAEYRGVANVVAETAWVRNLLCELHSPIMSATMVYCDNVSAVYMSANPVQHQWTKHMKIDIHFVRDMVTASHVRVLRVPSRFQYADIFTKGLSSALFEDFRSSLSVRPPPAPTAGAKDVEDLIESKSLKKLDDDDAVSLCCIGILQLVLLGLEDRRVVPNWILRDANVKRWLPLYATESTNEDDKKLYSIFGFTWAFKTWILEVFRLEQNEYYTRPMRYPRIVAWTSNKKFYRPMLRDFLYGRVHAERLIPNDVEAGSGWWLSSSSIFNMGTPTNWQTSIPSQPDSSNWQSHMPAYTPTPNWQPPIPSHPDDAGLCDPIILKLFTNPLL
nr:ribonuclease H-like domain-containing protein [Tanacetum cinerariifolium]